MRTSNRGKLAARITTSLYVGLAFTAAPAMAETVAEPAVAETAAEPAVAEAAPIKIDGEIVRAAQLIAPDQASHAEGESAFELSGNVAVVSDYRFRGVSLSGGDFALQGGIDLTHSSGFYVGTWGSSIDADAGLGELEIDLYGGWSGDVAEGLTLDLGLVYYAYPAEDTGADVDYFEALGSVGTTLGPVSATFGIGYSWDQASLGDSDNLYLYTDFESGIPDTPFTLTAHVGYTDGVFATQADGTSFDWGLGVSYALTDSLSLGFNYVDTQGPSFENLTDAGYFFTIGYSM